MKLATDESLVQIGGRGTTGEGGWGVGGVGEVRGIGRRCAPLLRSHLPINVAFSLGSGGGLDRWVGDIPERAGKEVWGGREGGTGGRGGGGVEVMGDGGEKKLVN